MVTRSPIGKNSARQASEHGDKTPVEMAKLWDGEISDRTISRALKKIGFTRKKRPMATANGMKAKAKHF
jgi:transposase